MASQNRNRRGAENTCTPDGKANPEPRRGVPAAHLGSATLTRRAHVEAAAERLRAVSDAPRREAEWLLADVLDVRRIALHAAPANTVPPVARARFERHVARRAAGEPLQYVLGHADFYGLRLGVAPGVLIPRPETEEVVGHALERIAHVRAPHVLDAGTGSGCIALAVKHERPDARVTACDVSAEALHMAAANAEALGLEVTFMQADLLAPDFAERFDRAFDLVISNPPYLPDAEAPALSSTVRDNEPPAALSCGGDPLRFYHKLAADAAHVLAPGGWLVLETHADYAAGVGALLRHVPHLKHVAARRDLAGRPRIAAARRL